MNPHLEQRIRFSGKRLARLLERDGDTPATRQAQAAHLQLLRDRTPEDHAELARRLGLQQGEAA